MLVSSSGDASWVSDDVVQGYTADAARDLDGTLKAYIAMSGTRERVKLAPHLAEIRCPVRLMIGTAKHDGGVGDKEVELLGRSVGSFAVDSVFGAGHFLQEEQPAAIVAALAKVQVMLGPRARRGGDSIVAP
jgi:pimeloyl-ACP methyl ester carboxylesterase